MSQPTLIAHRGLENTHPENTLSAYRAAFDLGLGIELDLAMTSDQQLVVIHDDTVDRTTDGSGRVSEMSLQELTALDVGSWKSSEFAGERVPTLDAALSMAADVPGIDPVIVLNVKTLQPGIINMICSALQEHGLLSRTVGFGIIAQSVDVRRRFYEGSTEFQCSAVAANAESLPLTLSDPYSSWILVPFAPSAQDIEAVHGAGKRMIVAGSEVIADQELSIASLEAGADAVISSVPSAVHARLNG